MPRTSKIVIALVFLAALATAPWLLFAGSVPDSTASRFVASLILTGIVYLFVAALRGKSICRLLSDVAHEKSKGVSFSGLRLGYLFGIYGALSSAALGLAAWALMP